MTNLIVFYLARVVRHLGDRSTRKRQTLSGIAILYFSRKQKPKLNLIQCWHKRIGVGVMMGRCSLHKQHNFSNFRHAKNNQEKRKKEYCNDYLCICLTCLYGKDYYLISYYEFTPMYTYGYKVLSFIF